MNDVREAGAVGAPAHEESVPTDITPFAVNQFIPHPMMVFAASTYNKDESPHLALVSWVNFYWDDGLGLRCAWMAIRR